MDASKLLAGSKIVPVVVLASADAAVPLAEALLAAGLGVIEVTLRTDEAPVSYTHLTLPTIA